MCKSNISLSIVHHGGASNAHQASVAFAEANLLQAVITTLAYNPDSTCWILNLLPPSLRTFVRDQLSRRTWVIQNRTITMHPWYEVLRIVLLKTQLNKIVGVTSKQIGDWGFLLLDLQVSQYHLVNINAIYSYEDLSAITFAEAKKHKILCLYDLPIPFYRTTQEIMQEEALRFPSLRSSIQSTNEPDWKLERKQQEIDLADHIFVASSISQKSLIDVGVSANKISVIPYGAPIDTFQPQPKSKDIFCCIFVGKISPLKGIHYLLQAWQEMNLVNTELLFVGDNLFPKGWLESNYSKLYRHISSVPSLSLQSYYSQASVLVLPSLVDGFGLVVLEAMACGIPVIVTVNTGASDIVTDGIDGFIIPIRDVEALKQKLEWCYTHPQELSQMGEAARRKAEQLHWGLYRQRLSSKVQDILWQQNHKLTH